jgi:preprotein translocase subunit SecG
MENLNALLMVFQVLVSVALIALVLLQHGKGADAGAAFGSGASATVFGAKGSGNFLTKSTAVLATLFFIICLSLAYLASNRGAPDSVMESIVDEQLIEQQQPAATPFLNQGAESDLPPATISETSSGEMDSDLPPTE